MGISEKAVSANPRDSFAMRPARRLCYAGLCGKALHGELAARPLMGTSYIRRSHYDIRRPTGILVERKQHEAKHVTIYIYIYIYAYMCMPEKERERDREGEREGGQGRE